jgi:hypothetical protein
VIECNDPVTGAEDTAALLVQTERSGSSVLIPGAFEKRAAGLGTSLRSALTRT